MNDSNKNMIYIGIDPGKEGAFTVLESNKILEIMIMPIIPSTQKGSKNEYDILAIVSFLEKYKNAIVILEKIHAIPMVKSTTAMFEMGKGFGLLLGILSALRMRYFLVHSKTWQSRMLRDINKKDTKQASIIIAQRLHPEQSFLATERSKKMHDGMTDSLLIAEYGSRYL